MRTSSDRFDMDSSEVGPLDLVLHSHPIDLSTVPSPMSNQTLIWNVTMFEVFLDLAEMGQMQDMQDIITLHYPCGLTVIVQLS